MFYFEDGSVFFILTRVCFFIAIIGIHNRISTAIITEKSDNRGYVFFEKFGLDFFKPQIRKLLSWYNIHHPGSSLIHIVP